MEDDEDEAESEEEEEEANLAQKEDQEDPEEEDQEPAEEETEEAIEEAIVVESVTKFGGVEDQLDCQRPEVDDPKAELGSKVSAASLGSRLVIQEQESRCYTSFTRWPLYTGRHWQRLDPQEELTRKASVEVPRAETPEPEMSTFSVISATVYSYPFAKRPIESKTSRCMESGGHISPIGSEQNPRTLPAAARQLEKRCATVTGRRIPAEALVKLAEAQLRDHRSPAPGCWQEETEHCKCCKCQGILERAWNKVPPIYRLSSGLCACHAVMRAWSECDHDGREFRSKGPAKKQQQPQKHDWEPRRSGKGNWQTQTRQFEPAVPTNLMGWGEFSAMKPVQQRQAPRSAFRRVFRCMSLYSLRFREFEKEVSFLSAQFATMAFATSWFCMIAAAALLWEGAADSRSQAPSWLHTRLRGLHVEFLARDFELVVASILAFLAFYFMARGCNRCRPGSFGRIVLDELIGASAFFLMLLSASIWDPVRRAVVLEEEEPSLGVSTSRSVASAALALSQLLALLMIATVPLRSSIFALVLLSTVPLNLMLDEEGLGLRLVSFALPFIYFCSRSRELTSRQRFAYLCRSEDLARTLREKEREAKSNMTLARGMQSLAGRRSDMVLILTSRLEVWRSTALQDLFFKQDMDGCSFLDILPPPEHEKFLATARRVREHKSGESMPLTLPRGYAKIILEYAGNEEDRYVMSILLDESADEAFRHDQCAPLRISSSKGYDAMRKIDTSSDGGSSSRKRYSLGKVIEVMEGTSEADSLCYSSSQMKSSLEEVETASVSTFTTLRDLGSEAERPRRAKGRDCEVQVSLVSFDSTTQATQTDLQSLRRDGLSCAQCARARPPRPRSDALPALKKKQKFRSRSFSGSCFSTDSSGSEGPDRQYPASFSDIGQPNPALESAELALVRFTAPCWPQTRPACVSTSLIWLLKHWNFSYLRAQCCPFHAALAVALGTLKAKKKDCCNPLWSPFTGWQCDFCTAMNHENSEHCDLCGSARTVGDQSAELSMTSLKTGSVSLHEDGSGCSPSQ
ncbi:unnamed protein product [Symbiodinium microadriaticum]|nr:unnamed protein product [Symbiodinium microadriaticum]